MKKYQADCERSFECANCRYKIGDYTGDPGYLLYIIFKTRIRLKFLKFKIRFFQLINKDFFLKCKTSESHKFIRIRTSRKSAKEWRDANIADKFPPAKEEQAYFE